MEILFILGSLEPGKDGVGDYTRLLAEECTRQGHNCALLALSDRTVTEPISANYEAGQATIPVLRLPQRMPWPERVKLAQAFREKNRPDWISLQFVPYAFHPKGIVCDAITPLANVIGDTPCHVMFHELWIGHSTNSPFLEKAMGKFQQHYIQKLLRRLKPSAITTSNPAYVGMLKRNGIEAHRLPLFGNIPIVQSGLPPQLQAANLVDENGRQEGWWIGLFFGAIHRPWRPEPLIEILLHAAPKANRHIALICAGRCGDYGDKLWTEMESHYSDRITLLKLGEQTPEAVSALMQLADFGVALSPLELLGKSGSAAAMLEHGLPLIIVRDDVHILPSKDKTPPLDDRLHLLDPTLEAKLIAGLTKTAAHSTLPDIAAQLIALLR